MAQTCTFQRYILYKVKLHKHHSDLQQIFYLSSPRIAKQLCMLNQNWVNLTQCIYSTIISRINSAYIILTFQFQSSLNNIATAAPYACEHTFIRAYLNCGYACNLPPLVLKARHLRLSGSAFCCMDWHSFAWAGSHWGGFPLDVGLVVEDRPTELSCIILIIIKHCQSYSNMAIWFSVLLRVVPKWFHRPHFASFLFLSLSSLHE